MSLNSQSKRQPKGDQNNNNKPTKTPRILSNSHGNLTDNLYTSSDIPEVVNVKVKRTKSFWKFGKNSSDMEILEGMSLWRHRDLVDLEEETKNMKNHVTKERKPSRDKSNDSDRTIIRKETTLPKKTRKNRQKDQQQDQKHDQTPDQKQLKQPSEEKSTLHDDFDDIYGELSLDDDGDGLRLKTVNRKNILQQYNDDQTADETDSSEMTTISDDPYDCIVVNDQKLQNFPNVAELGKKLEKLSKSTTFSPSSRKQRNQKNENYEIDRETGMIEQERFDDLYYSKQHSRKSTKTLNPENNDSNKKSLGSNRKYPKSSENLDELSNITDNRQFLPRNVKLTSKDTNNSNSLMEYGETLQRRLKNPELFSSKYDENCMKNGNMYGPWYDLWGLDASTRK